MSSTSSHPPAPASTLSSSPPSAARRHSLLLDSAHQGGGVSKDRPIDAVHGEAESMKKYQLMAPGPTPIPSEVLLAMAQPIIHHRTPEYEALFVEVRAGLTRLDLTSQEVLPL